MHRWIYVDLIQVNSTILYVTSLFFQMSTALIISLVRTNTIKRYEAKEIRIVVGLMSLFGGCIPANMTWPPAS